MPCLQNQSVVLEADTTFRRAENHQNHQIGGVRVCNCRTWIGPSDGTSLPPFPSLDPSCPMNMCMLKCCCIPVPVNPKNPLVPSGDASTTPSHGAVAIALVRPAGCFLPAKSIAT